MIDVTSDDKNKAYILWYRNYIPKNLDIALMPFLREDLKPFVPEKFSWIKANRTGLFLSIQIICEKLQICRSTYNKYEDGELNGSISLQSLSKIADAMDCELVYAIRPRTHASFSECIWKKLVTVASEHPSLKSYDPKHRPKSLAAIANRLMKNPNFKESQGWSPRVNQKKESDNFNF